jgi:hypothetical protein
LSSKAANGNVIVFTNALEDHELAEAAILSMNVMSGLGWHFTTLAGH